MAKQNLASTILGFQVEASTFSDLVTACLDKTLYLKYFSDVSTIGRHPRTCREATAAAKYQLRNKLQETNCTLSVFYLILYKKRNEVNKMFMYLH